MEVNIRGKQLVFISFVNEDRRLAESLAEELDRAGFPTWLYTRDAIPGPSYFLQTRKVIGNCGAFLLLISQRTLADGGAQITPEIVAARSAARAFIPVLVGLTFDDLQRRQPEWAHAIASASALCVEEDAPVESFAERLTQGLLLLGVEPETGSAPEPAVARRSESKRIVLLYKRNAQPDEEVLHWLDNQLTALGHQVFYDRRLKTGVEWPREIEKKVESADAVIPLLSVSSLGSEMLEEEIRVARESFAQHARPIFLPVRIKYDGPLPTTLGSDLDRIQYFLWKGPQDDNRLLEDIRASLDRPPRLEPKARRSAGGAMPLDTKVYISRPTDDLFANAITRSDSIVLVNGPRQMGKTSLLVRGLEKARKAGKRVLLTDFQKLNADDFNSADRFFRSLAELIADRLEPEPDVASSWKATLGPNQNFARFFRRQVLGAEESPLVWGLDEVDRLFSCSFGSDVFGLFRSWHNERALDPAGPWGRLTMTIVYATEANLFITDPNQSPFNVGTKLTLRDFTEAQVADFDRRYGNPVGSAERLDRFYRLLGGHPYLTHQGLEELTHPNASFDVFEETADSDQGPYADHLRRILFLLGKQEELLRSIVLVLNGKTQVPFEHYFRLRTAGVLTGENCDAVRIRCRVYERYLRKHLMGGATAE